MIAAPGDGQHGIGRSDVETRHDLLGQRDVESLGEQLRVDGDGVAPAHAVIVPCLRAVGRQPRAFAAARTPYAVASGDLRSHLGRGGAPARGSSAAPGGGQPLLPGHPPPQPAHALQSRAGGVCGRADRDGPARRPALRRRAGGQLRHRHRAGGTGQAGARPAGAAGGAARARPARRHASARSRSTTWWQATRSCCAREIRSWPTAACSRPAGLQVDESILTGESDPDARRVGETVQSGSFCVAGSGIYEAERVGSDAYANELTGVAREDRARALATAALDQPPAAPAWSRS